MSLFDDAVVFVFKHEGGYSCRPHDPGGATNYGISIRFLTNLKKDYADRFYPGDFNHDGKIDAVDIKTITIDQAKKIYYKYFWCPSNFDRLFDKLAIKAFDLDVTMGLTQCVKLLQRAYNDLFPDNKVDVDGKLGELTAKAINSAQSDAMYNSFINQAHSFYVDLVLQKPSLQEFLQGWLNRVNDEPTIQKL